MTKLHLDKVAFTAIMGALMFNLGTSNAHAETGAVRPVKSPSSSITQMRVYKSPTCGCCSDWVVHMQKANFSVAPENVDDTVTVKNKFGIPPRYRSCHTAVSHDGYVFEGHIPAKYIRQFMKEKPEGAAGLAVPAMPVGSPGMEVDSKFQPYQVLMLMKDGEPKVYATVNTYQSQF